MMIAQGARRWLEALVEIRCHLTGIRPLLDPRVDDIFVACAQKQRDDRWDAVSSEWQIYLWLRGSRVPLLTSLADLTC